MSVHEMTSKCINIDFRFNVPCTLFRQKGVQILCFRGNFYCSVNPNYYGYYSGTFYPREHLNSGHVVLKQSETYLDPERRLDLAKRFIAGSISQMKRVLKYYVNRRKENNQRLKKTLEELSLIQREFSKSHSI